MGAGRFESGSERSERPWFTICPNPLFDSSTVERCVVPTDVFATVDHTGKDLHPVLKRLLAGVLQALEEGSRLLRELAC